MRARFIFQGLTLFIPQPLSRGMAKAGMVESLTAYLISDPNAKMPPLHQHTPRISIDGRDKNNGNSASIWKQKIQRHKPGESTTVQLAGQGTAAGVFLDSSFIDYVPCLKELHWAQSTGIKDDFVVAKIVFTNGVCYTRNFIGWNWHGNTPARIAYMGTNWQGYGANEVVIEMGDNSDSDGDDDNKFLSIDGPGMKQNLWPRVKGRPSDEDSEPNTVEVLFTNLPARRVRAVPHGLHFEITCTAAGYPPNQDQYVNTQQYTDFVQVMLDYDKDAWNEDVAMMGHGQPFPYLINPRGDRLDALDLGTGPGRAFLPPPTPGRRAGEGWMPMGGMSTGGMPIGGMPTGEMPMGDDPDNYLICPHGRE